MKKLIFFSFICFALISLTLKDNAEFKGKVLDDQTGDPISFVNVFHIASQTSTTTDIDGVFTFPFNPKIGDQIRVSYAGYETKLHTIQSLTHCEIKMKHVEIKEEVIVLGNDLEKRRDNLAGAVSAKTHMAPAYEYQDRACWTRPENTESYDEINENNFLSVQDKALSTFSIDVDGASYSNVRRFINNGQKPPTDAVRIEELINYFDYDYDVDFTNKAFGLHSEIGPCPWNPNHQLLHVGIQGKDLKSTATPASNLVFLIDVSGSMRADNKLPLLIKSFQMLVNQLGSKDKVSIVTYAGNAGIVLEPTSGENKSKILAALQRLKSGGSTAGAAGINTAYDLAVEHYIKDGNNRVILATDGDFNVGTSGDKELEELIEEKRKKGIFLNVLGFGMGNYKDSKMQRLANKGNGQHTYIDNIHEARKIFVDELQGTLFTIAKDVKIQIEFNPAYVEHYRLIGYENRLLQDRDFNDDKKDAGEIGAGHSVTVLYEIVPVGAKSNINNIDPLKYQRNNKNDNGVLNNELATIKMRHKSPEGETSQKQSWIIKPMSSKSTLSEQFYWSAAMACFGMSLRRSDHLHDGNYDMAESLAINGKGKDPWGYRSEALSLIRSAKALFPISEEHASRQ